MGPIFLVRSPAHPLWGSGARQVSMRDGGRVVVSGSAEAEVSGWAGSNIEARNMSVCAVMCRQQIMGL